MEYLGEGKRSLQHGRQVQIALLRDRWQLLDTFVAQDRTGGLLKLRAEPQRAVHKGGSNAVGVTHHKVGVMRSRWGISPDRPQMTQGSPNRPVGSLRVLSCGRERLPLYAPPESLERLSGKWSLPPRHKRHDVDGQDKLVYLFP